jgi:hypothetical protein
MSILKKNVLVCWLVKAPNTKSYILSGRQWLTPVILATWEGKMGRITVPG